MPRLAFENVSFRYRKGGNVIQNVSFVIDAPEVVALVGHSGAGKTTIVNLTLKFYEPTAGNIFLNRVSYKELSHQQVRSQIGSCFRRASSSPPRFGKMWRTACQKQKNKT